jgi:hypothetical protein
LCELSRASEHLKEFLGNLNDFYPASFTSVRALKAKTALWKFHPGPTLTSTTSASHQLLVHRITISDALHNFNLAGIASDRLFVGGGLAD